MKRPSPNARVAPIGTRYTPATPLTEQRNGGTYHQRMPWPDDDAARLQRHLLNAPRGRADLVTALTCLLAVLSGLALISCT